MPLRGSGLALPLPRMLRTVLLPMVLLPMVLLPMACQGGPAYVTGLEPLPPGQEAVSLLGTPLSIRVIPGNDLLRLEADLEQALRDYEKAPYDERSFVWLGRRLAYLGRYREAVDLYTRGLNDHPGSYRLLRHRGHRYITLRELDHAVEDLSLAARLTRGLPDEVEPDGAPNQFNVPRSTTQTNIWYHLGLAHYLRGDWSAASDAFGRCLELSPNDDMWCAAANWQSLTLRRLGETGRADALCGEVREDMEILENLAYRELLLLHAGRREPEELLEVGGDPVQDVTVLYGVAVWFQLQGHTGRAVDLYRQILAGPRWDAFGAIAAEAELAHMAH